MKDAPEYLATNAKKFQLESVGSLVRSCPLSFYETLFNGDITYTLSTCINATHLVLTPPTSIANKLEIGKVKLVISVQVKKAIYPEVKLELSAPVFDDAYAYAWWSFGLPVPAGPFKGTIISQAETRIASELQAFISALG